ncbi:ABZJ_00895 family protein [Aureimonas sp. AU40]|uniref:ABZJ_00895 family protein n=1 Tax=Aureimonas sp. AU40 TaxID=1637747 RepID=UPI000784FAED|nr:ABZJ_00895 family protein [Aureimonas sp. AU40]
MTSPALSEQSLVGAFALLLIAISLIYGILSFVVASLVGFEMPAHAVNVLALMGAAMMVGNQDSERSGRCPGKALSWRLAI